MLPRTAGYEVVSKGMSDSSIPRLLVGHRESGNVATHGASTRRMYAIVHTPPCLQASRFNFAHPYSLARNTEPIPAILRNT